jgi:hypothetical protein
MSRSYPTGGFGYQEPQDIKTQVDGRKSTFGKLARLMQHSGNAWPTSYPGQPFLAFDALPDSTVPDQLRLLGYDVVSEGAGERILTGAIVEHFERNSKGELAPLSEGSTRAIAETRRHAGVVKVRKWTFDL